MTSRWSRRFCNVRSAPAFSRASARLKGSRYDVVQNSLADITPADLRVRRERPCGAAAEHALVVARLDLSRARPFHPDVVAREQLAFVHFARRHHAGVREI